METEKNCHSNQSASATIKQQQQQQKKINKK